METIIVPERPHRLTDGLHHLVPVRRKQKTIVIEADPVEEALSKMVEEARQGHVIAGSFHAGSNLHCTLGLIEHVTS
jgi:hypothetical protein